MKIPKELEEKLRKLILYIESPLSFVIVNTEDVDGDEEFYIDAIRAKNVSRELYKMLNEAPIEGKYKQLDIEEEIIKEKRNENY